MVGLRWIYKVNQATDGSVEKHKTRYVARGFSQVERIDYKETFSPVARYYSIISILDTFSTDGMEDASDGCEDNIPQQSD